jgi:hypothetical protein
MRDGHPADRKERRFGTKSVEDIEDLSRDRRYRSVIERQYDLVSAKKACLLLEARDSAEQRPAGGIDLDYARDAERLLRICAGLSICRRRHPGAEQRQKHCGKKTAHPSLTSDRPDVLSEQFLQSIAAESQFIL